MSTRVAGIEIISWCFISFRAGAEEELTCLFSFLFQFSALKHHFERISEKHNFESACRLLE